MAEQNSEQAEGVDLFGHPVEPIRDRRGRPCFRKDKQNQDFVASRVADGWTHKRIAEDMGVDEKTLRKHFSRELENGAVFMRGVLLDVLVQRVRAGHVPSVRLLAEFMKDAGPQAPRSQRPAEGPKEDANRPRGKKEAAVLDAQKIPDDYGDIFDRLKGRH